MIFLNGELRLEILEKDGGKLVIMYYLLLMDGSISQWVNLKVRKGGKCDVEEEKSGKWGIGLKYWEISLGWVVNLFSLVCDH